MGRSEKEALLSGSGTRSTGEVGFRAGLDAVAKSYRLGRTWN